MIERLIVVSTNIYYYATIHKKENKIDDENYTKTCTQYTQN